MKPFSAQSIIFTTTSQDQRTVMEKFLDHAHPSLKGKLDNAPDILWIEDEKALGIEQIRNLKEWVQEKPYSQDWKVAILLHADTLTGEAQNAALKLLEEPPSYAYIMLVTAKPFALQATVRSRCTVVVLDDNVTSTDTYALPRNIIDAFALTETLAKDRSTATQWIEGALIQHHKALEITPTQRAIVTVALLQSGLHNLKRNVNVRLAVEDVFLRQVYTTS